MQRLGDRLDVRFEWSVVLLVVGRVVADDVHDRGEGTARVVQARQGVAEPWAEMEEGGGWFLGDPAVAVGGAGDDAFEQPEHSTHLWNLVERRDEVHLGRAGIREANVDAGTDKTADQGLRTVHRFSILVSVTGRSGKQLTHARGDVLAETADDLDVHRDGRVGSRQGGPGALQVVGRDHDPDAAKSRVEQFDVHTRFRQFAGELTE